MDSPEYSRNRLFTSARLKLTLWYMIISYAMLAFFTLAAVAAHVRTFQVVEDAVHTLGKGIVFEVALQQQITQFEQNFIQRLLIFDILIAAAAGLASYILSGRTLAPIERMLIRQQQFAADASHELRTPLANITMEIAAHRQTNTLSAAEDELLVSIETEAQRMAAMVAGLLSLVRVDSHPISTQPVNLTSTISQAIAAIQPRYKQAHKTITTTLDSQLLTQGNAQELRQLLLILLENALLYSQPRSAVSVSAKLQASQIVILVHNQGPAIPQKELGRLFERFYRGANVTAQGTGLGLAIAQAIVTGHKGQIAVASNQAHGTTFKVSLPYLAVTADPSLPLAV